MSRHGRDADEAERELLLRYGIEPNPHADHFYEQELADRVCEQASLPPGDCAARRLARSRLGLGRSPYERPNAPSPPPGLRPGDAVTYRKLTAYLGSVGETRAVNQWAAGEREPSEAVQLRLRLALQVALMIAGADGPGVARAWFQGMNPQLDDRSPARLLREGDLDEVGPEVLRAARAFLVGG